MKKHLTRRTFLQAVGASGAGLLTANVGDAETTGLIRPNILWLSWEDMSPLLGCYGDPHARTPTLDAMAVKGTRYTRVFTVAPVCAPNRSCMISGVYPSTLGSHHMRSSGEGAAKSGMPHLPAGMKCFPEYMRDAGYYCTNNVKEDYNFVKPPTTWDDSSNKAHWRNRTKKDQPFFAVFNYTGTHESQVRGSAETHAKNTARLKPEDRQEPAKITPPPYHPDTPIVRQQWAQLYELQTALDYWVADRLKELEEDGLADNTIVFFWSDHGSGIPRCKRWLHDSGTHVPMIVHVPEKWRARANFSPGTVDERLISSIDLAPTVLNLVGTPIPEHMQGQAFLGPNQRLEREYVYGARDRMDERYDCFRSVRDKRYKYIRNYMPFKPYGQYLDYNEQNPIMRELRRLQKENALPEHCRWVDVPSKPIEELYDCDQDPHNLNNLASSLEHAETLKRLRTAHEKWLIDTRDLGLVPEFELDTLSAKFGSRYGIVAGMDKEDPEFRTKLRDVAVLAATASEADFNKLREALKSPHASIRYWAMVGIGLVKSSSKDRLESLKSGLDDSSAAVGVAAAQALVAMEALREDGMETLQIELASEQQWIRLLAAAALDELGEKARPAIPFLREALKDEENKYVARLSSHALMVLTGMKPEVV
jgi:arylsulfatase A-like enzyme